MSNKPQKLELTWIGKDEQPRLEPRILIEDPERSYGHTPNPSQEGSNNMLIHGDNLLALKALEQDFAGQIKCACIDPPYNTGKPWKYVLIPHNAVQANMSFDTLARRYEVI